MKTLFLPLLALVLLAGCQSSHTVAPETAVGWRGAVVSDPALLDVLETAWLAGPRDWEPRGWTIVLRTAPFPCGAVTPARGCTSSRRVIELVADVPVARWELGNARCYDRLGARALVQDFGWNCPI